jgi:osmotically-inducible protein OsmY
MAVLAAIVFGAPGAATAAEPADVAGQDNGAFAERWPSVVTDQGGSALDMWLQATTEVALFGEPAVSGAEVADIAVDANGNRLVLRGVVDSVQAWRAASTVARGMPGVQSLANELSIEPGTAGVSRPDDAVARDAAAALRATRTLRGAHLRLTVQDGIVTLTGSVADVSDWAEASRAARGAPGVRAVDNRLVIEHAELADE